MQPKPNNPPPLQRTNSHLKPSPAVKRFPRAQHPAFWRDIDTSHGILNLRSLLRLDNPDPDEADHGGCRLDTVELPYLVDPRAGAVGGVEDLAG